MISILLFGGTGQVGLELKQLLSPLGQVIAPSHSEVDFLDPKKVSSFILKVHPQIIINAAAYNDVDKAEVESELAYRVNAETPTLIARLAKLSNAILVHFSTNYVFDGRKTSPYTEFDIPHPINTYGKTKLICEQGIQRINGLYLIVRTSWVYSFYHNCFPTKIMKLSRSESSVKVVTDQIANPTWAHTLAILTYRILSISQNKSRDWWEERKGIYNIAGNGYCNRYEWAKTILKNDPRKEGQVAVLVPVLTKDFPSPAKRPLSAALSSDKISAVFGLQLQPWETALKNAISLSEKEGCSLVKFVQ